MGATPPKRPNNRLLQLLPQADFDRLAPELQPTTFEFKLLIYEAESPIDYVYFPNLGTLSAVTVMEDGNMVEVATYGNEGAAGLPVMIGGRISANRVFVQVAGEGTKIKVDILREEASRDGAIRNLFGRYHDFFLLQTSQSLACNCLHSVHRRCCRWLLMTYDRMGCDKLPLTHEFLGIMLGVRRSSVTEVLYSLQGRGLISYSRGSITILDRKVLEEHSCECYRRVRNYYDKLLGKWVQP